MGSEEWHGGVRPDASLGHRMPRRPAIAALLAAAAALLPAAGPWGVGGTAAAAARSVPAGFVGVNAGVVMRRPGLDLDREFALMASAGAETARTGFFWSDMQPYASPAQVPPADQGRFTDAGGVPTDFTLTDRFVAAAARSRIDLLPVVVTAPAWARRNPARSDSAPRGTRPYAAFLSALVARYGPRGAFWTARPDLPRRPLRAWQIWNEPDHDYYWHEQPFQRDYVALLRAARGAIRAADPGAKAVLGGLTGRSWDLLASIYRAGGRGQFDVAALHPYTLKVANVITTLHLVQRAMRRAGDARRPIWITEMSWPAAKGKVTNPYGIEVTPAVMAANVRTAYALLARRRAAYRLGRVYWESWLTEYRNRRLAWDWAGLRRYAGGSSVATPAFTAFRSVARSLAGR